METAFLRTVDIGRELRVSSATVQKYCRQGIIPAIKIGRSWMVRRDKWLEFLENREKVPSQNLSPDFSAAVPPDSLARPIPLLRLSEHDIEDALKNMHRPDRLERNAIASYLQRESGQLGLQVQAVIQKAFELLGSKENKLDNEKRRLVDYLDKRYRQKWQAETLSVEYKISREYMIRRYRKPALQMFLQAVIEVL